MASVPVSGLTLREMLAADLPEAIDLWVAAWTVAYPSIDFEKRRSWAVEHIADLEQDGSLSIVALAGGHILGFVVFDPNTGYLDQIVVATDAQGSGVAPALLAHARKHSPDGLDLHVNQDNARAVRFYEKNGFTKSGTGMNANGTAPTYKMSWRP